MMASIWDLKNNLTNILGWKTKKKIVVFESDDWGSIRTQSKKAFDNLLRKGIIVHNSKYDSLDSLEKKEDLVALQECLYENKSANGTLPIFTLNTVMGNPDFEAIKKSQYMLFYNQHFLESYKEYYGQNLETVWSDGINKKLIKPQFHAREHLNTPLWMNDLQMKIKNTRIAFENNFFGLKTRTSSKLQKHYLSAYRIENDADFAASKEIIQDGLNSFSKTFGFQSKSFIACNYTWPTELEPFLRSKGINFIQGQRGHINPILNQNKRKIKYHYTGQSNKSNQRYLVRNVHFEPYINQDKDWVNSTLKGISNAFFWKTPAIISTHRINYVSNMSITHRDASLKKLGYLLKYILKKWPDVIFLTSDELGKMIINEGRHP